MATNLRLGNQNARGGLRQNENAGNAAHGKRFDKLTTKNERPAGGVRTRRALAGLSNIPRITSHKNKANETSADADIKKEPVQAPIHVVSKKEPKEQSVVSRIYLNIDDGDEKDPQMCSDLVNDIYMYLKEVESNENIAINEGYLSQLKTDVTARMRLVLVDWLVAVHERFHMLPETLYLTVYLLDRYLQLEVVGRKKLQLIGVTAMWIAAKYEEMYAPELGDFVYIADNAYTKGDIKRMEIAFLNRLNFSGLARPLPLHFLRRYSKAAQCDAEKHFMAKYFMEVCLPEYDCVHLKPSYLAASATCLSLKIFDKDCYEWSSTLEHYTGYSEDELLSGIRLIAQVLVKADSPTTKHKYIVEKYSSSKSMRVAKSPLLQSVTIQDLAKQAQTLHKCK